MNDQQPQQPGWGQQQPTGPQPPTGYAPPPPKKSSAGKIVAIVLGSIVGFFVLVGGCAAVMVGDTGSSDDSTGSKPAASAPKDGAAEDKGEKAPRGAKWAAKGADTSAAGWDDVEIVSCKAGEFGYPKAEVKITNRSSDTSNYAIDLEFVDASGKRLTEGIVATNNLASGQSTTQEAPGLDEVSGEFECRFTKVMRYAS